MIGRREFLSTAIATALMGASSRASLAESKTYVIPEAHNPRKVWLKTKLEPGEIHVDPNQYALYWTLPNRRAIRFAVGIGRPGLYAAGEFTVGRKAEWPRWRPTERMIARTPAYARYADGMAGGPNNPLGARALYLYNARGYDSALRIHGTNKPWTIGHSISNGCARLINDHAIMLYDMVPVGTRVVLHPKNSA